MTCRSVISVPSLISFDMSIQIWSIIGTLPVCDMGSGTYSEHTI